MELELVKIDDSNTTIQSIELIEHYKVVSLTLYRAHKELVNQNSRIAILYNVFTILITSITGSSSLSLLFKEYQNLKVLNVILSYLVVALGTLYRYYMPDKMKEKHRLATEEYIRLYYNIIEILIFDKINIEIVKDINKQLETLRENSPYINDNIYDKYKIICEKTYKKHKKIET